MKKVVILLLCLLPNLVSAQSTFSPEEYVEFIQQNKNLSTEQLLNENPTPTTYFSNRQNLPNLSDVPWFDSVNLALNLTNDEEEMLEEQYFMVSERFKFHSWIGAFAHVYNRDLPLFLSTDFVLFTLHQSYDEILKRIEYELLEPNLILLLQAMYDYFPSLYAKYSSETEMIASLEDVDLYLAVALSLLRDSEVLPQEMVRTKYDQVMTAAESEEMTTMQLFTIAPRTRKLDFSQFTPRGHYTDIIYTNGGAQVTLEKYFRAMMWLGRIDFLLTAPPNNPWEVDWTDEELLRMNLSALLLNENLHACGKKELLDLHEDIISFMVGPDDNLSPDELQTLYIDSMQVGSVLDFLDDTKFHRLSELLNDSDDYGQKIMSNFFLVDPEANDPGELPISFKLLGQKFLVDSYIFSEVVYDRIIHEDKKIYRGLPDPLDILSAFGNENAMELMGPEMDSLKYAYKINELKYLIDSYDDSFWEQSLYNNWLSALIQLNPVHSNTNLPYFMKTVAWNHEKLNTQLASWAQLRHDNILYGKQSYTGGTGCSFPYTYVEPYPSFYQWIQTFAENASDFFARALSDNPDLTTNITGYYDRYAEIMSDLGNIAGKELSGIALDVEELTFLKTMINDYMSSGPSVTGWINDLLFPSMDMWDFDFTVADVHTQPSDAAGNVIGHVLHVGNGLINLGVFIAPNSANPESHMCYVGPLGSFHTFVEKDFKRLNDIEYEEMFLNANYPDRPEWVKVYLLDSEGKKRASKQMLKGETYNGTQNISREETVLSYLLAYPNPAQKEVRFRFILNERSYVSADILDVSGRIVFQLMNNELAAAEHDLPCPLNELSPGSYFIRLKVNDRVHVQQFVVK